jgi:hypothetical protein
MAYGLHAVFQCAGKCAGKRCSPLIYAAFRGSQVLSDVLLNCSFEESDIARSDG